MFGMGFMEILLIAIIAVIALGPDKLPEAMVQIAKFINKFKTGLADAKSTLDNELNISEMKSEANKFKSQIEETKASLSLDSKIDLGLNEILKDDSIKEKTEKVSFKKENKSKEKLDNKEENA